MKADELRNPADRKHAEREERRKRARTYKRDETVRAPMERWTPENRRLQP